MKKFSRIVLVVIATPFVLGFIVCLPIYKLAEMYMDAWNSWVDFCRREVKDGKD